MARPLRPGALWLWMVGILAAAVGANLVAPVVTAIALKEPLRTLLGASQVDVALETWPPVALWWGSADRMTVLARDVEAGDVRLERFSATFHHLRVDPRALYTDRALVIRSVGFGSAQGTVSQEALARALARQSGVRVDMLVLRPSSALVRGVVRILGIDVAVEGAGRFVLGGTDALDLILDRVTLTEAGSSTTLGGQLTTRIPSVLRIPTLPLGLRLTDVRMDDGGLVLDAATGPS